MATTKKRDDLSLTGPAPPMAIPIFKTCVMGENAVQYPNDQSRIPSSSYAVTGSHPHIPTLFIMMHEARRD